MNFMEVFKFFAQPWWVNLLVVIPFVAYFIFRKRKLDLDREQLLLCFLFGIAFGLVEASVVIYLRAAFGMLSPAFQPTQTLDNFSSNLLLIEFMREAATMVMLVTIALLAAKATRERWAIFLWTFATWDLFYYVFLWLTIRWPSSLTGMDVLFLIPVPWYAQVWFPVLVDTLTMLAILATMKGRKFQSGHAIYRP